MRQQLRHLTQHREQRQEQSARNRASNSNSQQQPASAAIQHAVTTSTKTNAPLPSVCFDLFSQVSASRILRNGANAGWVEHMNKSYNCVTQPKKRKQSSLTISCNRKQKGVTNMAHTCTCIVASLGQQDPYTYPHPGPQSSIHACFAQTGKITGEAYSKLGSSTTEPPRIFWAGIFCGGRGGGRE